MIELSEIALELLTGSYTYYVRAESWLGTRLLADEIPIVAGTEFGDRTLRVPERVALTVPRVQLGYDWTPYENDSPLAANGQRLKIELGIGTYTGEVEWFQRGWFVITDSQVQGEAVTIECAGLLKLIDEARLVSPFQPTSTMLGTVQGLVGPTLTVLNGGLTDRSVPSDVNFDEDRLGALFELMDAWPGDMVVTPQGYLSIAPIADDDDEPVITLTHGSGGTVIEAYGKSTRADAWNVVVARGTASDGSQVQGVSYLERGPKIYGGDFNPMPVPYFLFSPLITTIEQANQAARVTMQRLARKAERLLSVEMVPHPALVLGDVIELVSPVYSGTASIEALSLPYTPEAGAQTLTVRALE